MPTIRDVARAAGVSSATVSHVMNGSRQVSVETRAKVLQAIQDLRYRRDGIARSLRRTSTGTIGLIVSDITNPFFADLVRGLEDRVYAQGAHYTVVLCNTDEDLAKEKRYLDVLSERRVDGLVMVPVGGNEDHLNELRASGVPIVFADRLLPGVDVDAVTVNNRAAARQLVDILIANGHRRVAALEARLPVSSISDRMGGYYDALEHVGVTPAAGTIVVSRSTLDDAVLAGNQLLSLPTRPSAVFCSNNFMTLGVIQALQGRGLRCPEDVAVVGVDDFPWAASFRPRLTVAAQPAYKMGQMAASLLFKRINRGADSPSDYRVLPSTLFVRESCGSRAKP